MKAHKIFLCTMYILVNLSCLVSLLNTLKLVEAFFPRLKILNLSSITPIKSLQLKLPSVLSNKFYISSKFLSIIPYFTQYPRLLLLSFHSVLNISSIISHPLCALSTTTPLKDILPFQAFMIVRAPQSSSLQAHSPNQLSSWFAEIYEDMSSLL